jgi:hypothetical protein
MSEAVPRAALTNDQLVEMMTLIKDADSVELKLTVPDADRRATAAALDVDPLEAQIRQVVFFDTPDLTLNQAGIVVRARRVQGAGDDSVIKLRPVVPHEVDESLRRSPNFVVEVDAMPGGYVCSGSFKAKRGPTEVKEVFGGTRPIRKLFTKEQRAFFAEHAPDGHDLDALSVLGPITVFKLKFRPAGYDRRLVAEMWFYPDGSRVIELSTKCAPGEAFQVAAETTAFLVGRGVNVAGEQQTKTRSALEFFAQELATE